MSTRGSVDEQEGRQLHGKGSRRSIDSARSSNSSSSDDEDGLLPSFGLDDAVSSHGYAIPPAQAEKAASASAISLGLDTQNVNGFVSREDLISSNGGANGHGPVSSRGKKGGKGKKLTWQERERQRTRAFAREMAFVVGAIARSDRASQV